MANIYKKIILPTHPHPDTIVAIFLLKTFGLKKYPGVEKAEIDIWQELPKSETLQSLDEKGILVLDLGGGKFDHHQKGETTTSLIAKDLEIIDDPGIKKLLAYVERDDKYGLGTISTDPLDRAFGLSGLISSLNKVFFDNPQRVIDISLLLLRAHYIEEKKRTQELPKEFEKSLTQGKAEIFEIKQKGKKLKIVTLESDNMSMPGWLRSADGQKADVICQKMSSGYTNIITKPLKRVDLRWVVAYLRDEEIKTKGEKLNYSTSDLMKQGKLSEIPEWYYDRATNSILNGGTNPKGIPPTSIPFGKIKEILKEAFSRELK